MKLRKPVKKVLIGAIIAYLILGTCWSAYDSHKHSDRFQECVRYGMCFVWEGRWWKMELKELREKNRFSLEQLAEIVGVTKMMIYFYETKKCKPKINVAIKIAQVFNVDVKDINW